MRYAFALIHERSCFCETVVEVANDFLASKFLVLESLSNSSNLDLLASLRSDVKLADINCAFVNLYTFCFDSPVESYVAYWSEEIFVVDFDCASLSVLKSRPDVLVIIFDFPSVWIWLTVRIDYTVTVEVVVRSRETAKVATVSVDVLACNLAL